MYGIETDVKVKWKIMKVCFYQSWVTTLYDSLIVWKDFDVPMFDSIAIERIIVIYVGQTFRDRIFIWSLRKNLFFSKKLVGIEL